MSGGVAVCTGCGKVPCLCYLCEECDEPIPVGEDTEEGGVPLVCARCYEKAVEEGRRRERCADCERGNGPGAVCTCPPELPPDRMDLANARPLCMCGRCDD